jgi:hypothetical protein
MTPANAPPVAGNGPRTPERAPTHPKDTPRIVRFMLSSDGDTCDACGAPLPPYFLVYARTDGHLFCSETCHHNSPPSEVR